MKISRRGPLMIISLILLFQILFFNEINAQSDDSETLKVLETQHTGNLKSLNAKIKMVRYNSYLQESDISEGNLIYLSAKNRKEPLIRINWTRPVREIWSFMDGKYAVVTSGRLQENIVGKPDLAERADYFAELLMLMDLPLAQLKSSYQLKFVAFENLEGNTCVWHFELTAKSAGQRHKSVEIWTDSAGMTLQIKSTKQNNDSTILTLSNLEKNISSAWSLSKS